MSALLSRFQKFPRPVKTGLVLLCCFALSLLLEVFGFNLGHFLTKDSVSEEARYAAGPGLKELGGGSYAVTDPENAYFEVSGIGRELKYIRADIRYVTDEDAAIAAKLRLSVTDKGHALFYDLGTIAPYYRFARFQYFRLHTYGAVDTLRLYVESNYKGDPAVKVAALTLDPQLPLMLWLPRVAVITALLFLLWMIRPAAAMYRRTLNLKERRQKLILCAVILVNVTVFFIGAALNTQYKEFYSNDEYPLLADALLKGQFHLDFPVNPKLSAMENPYDYSLRKAEEVPFRWDFAYYNGRYYCYFGIVPALLLFLPFKLLTGRDLLTWAVVPLLAGLALIGVFYLLRQIIRRWFSHTPFGVYLILGLLMGNACGMLMESWRPEFYPIPIFSGLAFTFFGLGLWIRAADSWDAELIGKGKAKTTLLYLLFGSLCLALVAGCRPQLVLGSFFCFPLLASFVIRKDGRKCAAFGGKLLAFALPYFAVAAFLMYYNYARFGSPFDFGANYNLTGNDMTLRGLYFDRLPLGLFTYLFQAPNINLRFPFVHATNLAETYLGLTVDEGMYGGVFVTHLFLLFPLLTFAAKDKLKEKKLCGFIGIAYAAALIIAAADTEMAGILSRYCSDFLWLLFLAAVLVFLSLWEGKAEKQGLLLKGLVILTVLDLIFCFFAALSRANLAEYGLVYHLFASIFV